MESIDTEFKTTRVSIRAHLGSILVTVAVFTAIATTGVRVFKLEPKESEDKPVYYLAPPQDYVEVKSSAPDVSNPIDTSSITLEEMEPSVELELSPIDVSFNPDVSSDVTLNFDISQDFQAAPPGLEEFQEFTIYDQTEVDEKPVLRFSVPPSVPYSLRGEAVDVVVFYYVSEKGRTERQSVLYSSSENPTYGDAAKDAIKSWRFRPAKKNGKPVACWVQQTVQFNEGSTSPFTL
ncbi:energy transducer TonB [Pelagicoccus mobilis]|uniref:TonB family protein n=1 Tax=Pelagicoccus mobilis TaxID=415221 RepID=A0A934VTW2_9BACT|nr:energy transducer TonB [Pelagicoccus mobilis]MBK1879919.1 TonB family protein [Pelagicoccus mobilis]